MVTATGDFPSTSSIHTHRVSVVVLIIRVFPHIVKNVLLIINRESYYYTFLPLSHLRSRRYLLLLLCVTVVHTREL